MFAPTNRNSSSCLPMLAFLLSACLLILCTGCNGCVSEDPLAKQQREEDELDPEKRKKKLEKKKEEDFTFQEIRVQPNDFMKNRAKINYVKRGHWVATTQQIKANNFDVQAEMKAITTNLSSKVYDIEHTRYSLAFSRPAAFPKGQTKPVESLFFIPRESVQTQSVNLRTELVNMQGGDVPIAQFTSILPLEEWQYVFLVLSPRASAYALLDQTQTFSPYRDESDTTAIPIRYYQLIRPALDKTVPLPTNALTWTSVAVILWDDLDPTLFTPEQQQALVDWLHWGGQLIVNGPNSIDRLRNSFLDPYLPADNAESVNLTQHDFNELNEHWSLRAREKPLAARDLQLVKPLAGLRLQCRAEGAFLAKTGKLVAERRIGQGRIVLTAFPLNSSVVQNWANFDGFLNCALLRRPGRRFLQHVFDTNNVDNRFNPQPLPEAIVPVQWAEDRYKSFDHDARLVSNLRFFARDISFEAANQEHPFKDLVINRTSLSEMGIDPSSHAAMLSTALKPGAAEDERFGGWMSVPRAGVASWNDFSGAANAARQHVTDAAGIRIPSTEFVIRVLGIYILVLVPLNWCLFRALGRVEWAWIAAPLIAIVGAFTVVRLAHLDIGFVRSRTEIDVLEIHGGYSRAHVSRYINLYTALATYYDLVFEDPTALAQPLPEGVQNHAAFSAESQVQLHRDTKLSLSGFKVQSNSQGLVHVEQLLDLGGKLELLGDENVGWKVSNGTSLELKEVALIRRTEEGYSLARIDLLASGNKKSISFSPPESSISILEIAKHSTMLQPQTNNQVFGELRLGRFTRLATERLTLHAGDVRLIAWAAGEVPGIEYRPDSAQVNAASFIIAHLRRGSLPVPERDANVLADIKPTNNASVITPEDLESKSKTE